MRLLQRQESPMVPVPELENAYRNALRLLSDGADGDDVGDYLEFGVYVGTSLLCMDRASRAVGFSTLRLFGFDSFEGLPEDAADEKSFNPGWFRAEYGLVREHLTRQGIDWDRTTLVPGWYDDTLRPELAQQLGIEKAGVIMIDCDIYSSTRTALAFCAPLIGDRAVIFFDDWPGDGPDAQGLGERRAFEEFLAENPTLAVEELESFHPPGWKSRSSSAKVVLVSRATTSARP
jgi:O-methyltransferase